MPDVNIGTGRPVNRAGMRFETHQYPNAEVSLAVFDETEALETASDFLGVLMSAPTSTVALRRDDLPADFFILSSGLAGEMLQKVSNYRKTLVVLGDFSDLVSSSFRQFRNESNRSGQVVFVSSLEEALPLLGK